MQHSQSVSNTHPKPKARPGRRWLWISLLVFATAGVYLLAGSGITTHDRIGWRLSYHAAETESGETGKSMLVLFTADWCGPCNQMKAWVFSDQNIAEAIESRFIPVKVDLTREGLPDQYLADRYQVRAIPTLLTLMPDGEPISIASGYLNKTELMDWLDTADARYAAILKARHDESQSAFVEPDPGVE
ncbi:MAG: hypothetical protein Kow00105_08820 [Phycisphaeraceae bacterium]